MANTLTVKLKTILDRSDLQPREEEDQAFRSEGCAQESQRHRAGLEGCPDLLQGHTQGTPEGL